MIQLAVRDLQPKDAASIMRYWAEATDADLERMGELSRPDENGNLEFLRDFSANPPKPDKATEDLLIWTVNREAIGYSTLKAIQYKQYGEIHLHMWARAERGKGYGAVLFCLSALRFRAKYELKQLFCQPKVDNPMPNRMLARIGFAALTPRDWRRDDGSIIQHSRYVISEEVIHHYLASARGSFAFDPRSQGETK